MDPGYIPAVTRELRSRGFTVTVHPWGLPGAVLSSRILNLGRQYGRTDAATSIIEQQAPFIFPTTTLLTIFAGDVGELVVPEPQNVHVALQRQQKDAPPVRL